MATILEMTIEQLEKNNSKRIVRNLGGNEFRLAGVNIEEKKISLYLGVVGDTAEFEIHPYRGYLFFCQICEKWRGMKNLCPTNYPLHIVCEACIDHLSHEGMLKEQEEQREEFDKNWHEKHGIEYTP